MLVLAGNVGFYPLDAFVSWCCSDNLFWSDGNAPSFGARGRAAGCLVLTKLSLMSPPQNVQQQVDSIG